MYYKLQDHKSQKNCNQKQNIQCNRTNNQEKIVRVVFSFGVDHQRRSFHPITLSHSHLGLPARINSSRPNSDPGLTGTLALIPDSTIQVRPPSRSPHPHPLTNDSGDPQPNSPTPRVPESGTKSRGSPDPGLEALPLNPNIQTPSP